MPLFYKKRNPPMFQGSLDKKQYFEGWYFKLVDEGEKNKYAVIPGISLDKQKGTSHAFIQVLQGTTGDARYFKYSLDKFWTSEKDFEVKLGENRFTATQIDLAIDQDGHKIKGSLQFKDIVPWPKFRFSPGVMGWYQFMPFMECYHGLVSLNHTIEGQLSIDGKNVNFSGGKGYIEKDYGRSFPSAYIWMQSNHFEQPQASFMASIATIPWLGRQFLGFLIIFWYNGQFYRLTTYTGAKILGLEIAGNKVSAIIGNKQYVAEFNATKHDPDKSGKPAAGDLKSPVTGEMQAHINESLLSEVHVRFYELSGKGADKKLLFEGTGRNAGVEIEATKERLKL